MGAGHPPLSTPHHQGLDGQFDDGTMSEKNEEMEWNTGRLGGYERAFDGDIEAWINLMEHVM
jgi:hypothetical protein